MINGELEKPINFSFSGIVSTETFLSTIHTYLLISSLRIIGLITELVGIMTNAMTGYIGVASNILPP